MESWWCLSADLCWHSPADFSSLGGWYSSADFPLLIYSAGSCRLPADVRCCFVIVLLLMFCWRFFVLLLLLMLYWRLFVVVVRLMFCWRLFFFCWCSALFSFFYWHSPDVSLFFFCWCSPDVSIFLLLLLIFCWRLSVLLHLLIFSWRLFVLILLMFCCGFCLVTFLYFCSSAYRLPCSPCSLLLTSFSSGVPLVTFPQQHRLRKHSSLNPSSRSPTDSLQHTYTFLE